MEAQLEQLEGDRVRLTVEVPGGRGPPRGRARDARPRRPGQGARASAPGKVPEQVLVSADRQAAPLLRGGRVAHRQLVLERRAHEPAAADRAARVTTTSCRRPTTRAGSSRPSSRSRPPVEPADWTKLEVPKLEVEVPDEVVDEQLAALQAIGRAALAGRGPPGAARRRRRRRHRLRRRARASATTSSSSGPERLVDELEEAIRGLVAGESEEVAWELARRLDARRDGHAEGALREGAAAARRRASPTRRPSSTRSTSCARDIVERIRDAARAGGREPVPRRGRRRAR